MSIMIAAPQATRLDTMYLPSPQVVQPPPASQALLACRRVLANPTHLFGLTDLDDLSHRAFLIQYRSEKKTNIRVKEDVYNSV